MGTIRPNEARRWAVPTPFSLIYSAVPFMTGSEYLISGFAPGRTRRLVKSRWYSEKFALGSLMTVRGFLISLIFTERKVVMMQVRLAQRDDLERVNELRRQVNDVHTAGRPDIFRPGFGEELCGYVYTIFDDPSKDIAVAETDGVICGFAVLNCFTRPENPFMYERRYVDVDELCVDEGYRRQGIGAALIEFARSYAKKRGFDRIELNMWEFNGDALGFYEAMGFTTYRRYMEMAV